SSATASPAASPCKPASATSSACRSSTACRPATSSPSPASTKSPTATACAPPTRRPPRRPPAHRRIVPPPSSHVPPLVPQLPDRLSLHHGPQARHAHELGRHRVWRRVLCAHPGADRRIPILLHPNHPRRERHGPRRGPPA